MADLPPDFDNNASPIVHATVSVGTVATKLCVSTSLDSNTEYIIIENKGNSKVYIGPSGVTTTNGLTLYKRDRMVLSCQTGKEWYGIVGSGTNDVYVIEMGS